MIKNSLEVNPIRTDYSLTNNADPQHRDIFRWCLSTKDQYDCVLFIYAWFDMRVSSCMEIFSAKECNLMYDKVLGKYNKEINDVTHGSGYVLITIPTGQGSEPFTFGSINASETNF